MDSSQEISNKWLLGLREAIESKDYSYLQEYLAAGLNFNTRETDGFTPLQIALRMNNIEMVRFLLENKADPNQDFLLSDQWSYDSPLHFTLAKRSSAMAILLIEYGANIFAMSHAKIPLICTAVKNDRVKVIRYLMDNGTSPDTLINDELSLLTYAVEEMKIGVVKCILKYKPDVNLHQHKRILSAATHGYICGRARLASNYIVRMLYKYGFTLDQTDINCGLIREAIDGGHYYVFQNLLELGVSPNFEMLYDQSRMENIIHTAVRAKELEMVQLLLKAGADIHIRDDNGRTPILHAARVNSLSLVRLLLKYGANVTDVDRLNQTVLHSAIMPYNGDIPYYDWISNNTKCKLVKLFISKGVDVHAKSSRGSTTALDFAAFVGIPSVIEVLLAHGARIDVVNSSYKTPFEMALITFRRNVNCPMESAHTSEVFTERKAATIQLLKQHIHRLHRIGLPICPKDLEYKDNQLKLSDDINNIIESESQFIKKTQIGDSFITLQRFLKSTDEEAAGFIRNDSILENLKMMLQSPNKFYGYADLIGNKLTIALKKNALDKDTFKFMNIFFEEKKLPSLPDECIRHIISFFTDEDKKVVTNRSTR